MSYKGVIIECVREVFHGLKADKQSVSHNDMYRGLCSMIEWTRQFKRQPGAIQLSKVMSDMEWAKEYSTVKFGLPRQSGHTGMISRLLDLGRMNGGGENPFLERAVVMFPNVDMAIAAEFSPGWSWVGTANMKSRDKFRGQVVKAVVVDAAPVLSKKETNKIYRMFAEMSKDPEFVFVFLG